MFLFLQRSRGFEKKGAKKEREIQNELFAILYLSELVNVHVGKSQDCQISKSAIVLIGKCPRLQISKLTNKQVGNVQVGKGPYCYTSKLENIHKWSNVKVY